MKLFDEIRLSDHLIERVQLYKIEHSDHTDENFILMEVLEITDKTLYIRYRFDDDIRNYEDWNYSRLKYVEFEEAITVLEKVPRNSLTNN